MRKRAIWGILIMGILILGWGSVFAQMVLVETNISGDQTITIDTQILSIVEGNIVINPGVTLQLDGIVNGNIEVEENAVLILNGIVNGNVTLKSGAVLTLNGIIGENLYNQSGNEAEINGIVKGEIF